MIYITSDWHLSHNCDFIYKPRGFSSIEEHDKTIIANINKVVKPDDELWHLGDEMLMDNTHGMDMIRQINCKNIHLLIGNHTTNHRIELLKTLPNIVSIDYASRIKYGKWGFWLSHYPTAVGNFYDEQRHTKFYSLAGHTHTKDRFKDFNTMKCYHVEVDAHDNFPVSIEEIIEDIKKKGTKECIIQ